MADEQYTPNQEPQQMPPIDNTGYMPPASPDPAAAPAAQQWQEIPQPAPQPDTRYNPYEQPQYQQGSQPVEQPVFQQPVQQVQPVQQYQQPYDQQYQPYQQPYYSEPPVKDNSGVYILIAILEIIFLGGLFAIIPLVFAIQMRGAISRGDWATAEAKGKSAKMWLIIAPVIAIVILIIGFASGAYSSMLN